jgi:hypothetical protein
VPSWPNHGCDAKLQGTAASRTSLAPNARTFVVANETPKVRPVLQCQLLMASLSASGIFCAVVIRPGVGNCVEWLLILDGFGQQY